MKRSDATSRRQRADIYREAARLIERGVEVFTCFAISMHTNYSERNTLMEPYREMFAPRGADWSHSWFVSIDDLVQRQDCRVLALCFMAAMVEAGDA